MTSFLVGIAVFVFGFLLGYYVNGHPEDTRTFLVKTKVAIQSIFRRGA